jgi:hypothetical protein
MDIKLDRLLDSVNAVIRANAGLRVNDKVASNRTQEYSEQFMKETCRRLHGLGFPIEEVFFATRETHRSSGPVLA